MDFLLQIRSLTYGRKNCQLWPCLLTSKHSNHSKHTYKDYCQITEHFLVHNTEIQNFKFSSPSNSSSVAQHISSKRFKTLNSNSPYPKRLHFSLFSTYPFLDFMHILMCLNFFFDDSTNRSASFTAGM